MEGGIIQSITEAEKMFRKINSHRNINDMLQNVYILMDTQDRNCKTKAQRKKNKCAS